MDLLVWPTVKAQLYILEARKVKNAVGRDRIRRNKDALRELRCLQEILGDIHAGDFGRAAPERRRAAADAANQWADLQVAARAEGRTAEELCQVPLSIRRYLLVSPGPSLGPFRSLCAKGGTFLDSGTSAPSTRAPSTTAVFQEMDSHSTAPTDGQSEASYLAALAASDGRPASTSLDLRAGTIGSGQRMSCEQLEKLATELRDQLDEEHTSLMASIEEVQQMMEVEVADASLMPSLSDLESFCSQVDMALARFPASTAPSSPSASSGSCRDRRCRSAVCTPVLEAKDSCDDADTSHEQKVESAAELDQSFKRLHWTPQAGEDLGIQRDPEEQSVRLEQVTGTSSSSVGFSGQRPRWADMASDSESDQELRHHIQPITVSAVRSVAECNRCQQVRGRNCFSRRAWRQARGSGAEGSRAPTGASCLVCSKSSSALPVVAGLRDGSWRRVH